MPIFRLGYSLLKVSVCSVALTSELMATTLERFSEPFQEPEFLPTQSDFGGVGLIQMPSGRMAKEGTFSFSAIENQEYQFYAISLQLLPWLETSIRYTQVEDVLYNPSKAFSGDTKYTDKGIDTKVRLLKESFWLPNVSVGLRDLGGTGLFDGEYLVASKRFGDFDFTLGLGWGYLGTRGNVSNPLCTYSDEYCSRSSEYSGNGGEIDYNRWFTGPSSLFGGVEYQTPFQPLRLKLEYDGNDYSSDFPVIRPEANIDMTPKTPWNIGAIYSFNDSANIRLSYERGTTISLGFTLSTNFDSLKSPLFDEPIPPLGNQQAKSLDEVNWLNVSNELTSIAGYDKEKFYVADNTVSVVAEQSKYRDRNQAIERASAVLSNHMPDNIEYYNIVETKKNIPVKSDIVSSKGYRKVAEVDYFNPTISDTLLDITAPSIKNQTLVHNEFKRFSTSLTPHLDQSVGNPESFYIYSLSLRGGASYWLTDQLEVSSSVALNLIDNLDELNFDTPTDHTSNYRVRTLVRAYVRENDIYLNNLQLTWFEKYGKNWYQQVYGGYLESMFAGVGSEILYRQKNSNWAVGADFNIISQRNPSSYFDTYSDENGYSNDTKVLAEGTTGHFSIYYQPDFSLLENTRIQLDIGKFLAEDRGVRVDFSKQYKSGIIVGAYASLTDMSAEDFGEGSFTKGFYLSIPFDTVSLKPTNTRGSVAWQPITRDGGQMLGKRYSLYNITDVVSPWFQRPNQN
ncbi:WbfB protein [Marinomonas ushuaiensis DSM 15871]|uniref:WbfB protein n=1 Tax=Marinomonas ushuaiensis DSM 15871 TaxID=1122207 RepID=X7EBS3_9GAMM|nr:YjbH domain-containing protein [Marinomonas ushuaiensis]ETX12568.1 WbfB protein [Marinomonas ushuaiensis DSM 15871]